ncbi:Os09g0447700 [Oryza sativa Japonica Group]|uniref:Os09g0447700 protein n=1 Tax=Oryza sativa subsp. japonica TaxID=39947 RepID=A0A0P0XMG7_ORYSJ|nr:Os09g0447700 [Oryza sativa Japonica Group]
MESSGRPFLEQQKPTLRKGHASHTHSPSNRSHSSSSPPHSSSMETLPLRSFLAAASAEQHSDVPHTRSTTPAAANTIVVTPPPRPSLAVSSSTPR